MITVTIDYLQRSGMYRAWAERVILNNHYLHTMPDPRTSYEMYTIGLHSDHMPLAFSTVAGVLVFGRAEAQRCRDWYGSVEQMVKCQCEVTRWQVLNLSRVWIDPHFQPGGMWCRQGYGPGYVDRHGIWRSTLASTAINIAARMIGYDYLVHRPPVYLDEPYEIRWMMSYCDTRLHQGTIYRAAGFEMFATANKHIVTWRKRIPGLTAEQRASIEAISRSDPRAVQYRSRRAQLALPGVEWREV